MIVVALLAENASMIVLSTSSISSSRCNPCRMYIITYSSSGASRLIYVSVIMLILRYLLHLIIVKYRHLYVVLILTRFCPQSIRFACFRPLPFKIPIEN